MASYNDVIERAKRQAEIEGIEATRVEWLFLDLFNWSRLDLVLNGRQEMSLEDEDKFSEALRRLLAGEPIQYIVGFQMFYGERFKVTPDCLIPRAETEEVTMYFLQQLEEEDLVVDVGTGSGVIPVTLKKALPSLEVIATDISDAALKVAEENAHHHQTSFKLFKGDALKPLIERGIKVDGLISNPPYIGKGEIGVMDKSVYRFEPHSALFAEQEGLAIYKRIIKDLPYVLNANAVVTFEIGYRQGELLKAYIEAMYPGIQAEVQQDINGNPRILSFRWYGE
ncbi:peptide chain release factor N(5)-glutamine methyltransferase [Staphylococcus sp. SQ8-PEA]|uniref:Release factor glutamine methyltransferase n=1 Tax=Staphylococcus marylandisciuri TaxID=2981529 RepID=A0ABT2QRK1_9STAP|nr:peptide chain release factor N(5)-glutamine methyltransferase [Staphylococcus marylandisciuri]MCU5746582.1 peptide chain release factor N(5)-glutamine methyltransferase [Staphylococcus marylandisciuri]